MKYEIKLPQFEGPFDLLLFFIERDELDIYDIPIAKITSDFLEYIHQMNILNIELASEFILVAATLMRIKAKLLLPRKEVDEEGNEIDPREELVQKLLEYKLYKEVMGEFRDMETNRLLREKRGNIARELSYIADNSATTEDELESVTLYKLLKVFQRVMERYEYEKNKPVHTVVKYPFTIQMQKDYLRDRIAKEGRASFEHLFEVCTTRLHAVFTFLALLEMLQERLFTIQVGEGKNNFWIAQA